LLFGKGKKEIRHGALSTIARSGALFLRETLPSFSLIKQMKTNF